jgi:hypothetical protein
VFTGFSDASINEEVRKMFENFAKLDFNQDHVYVVTFSWLRFGVLSAIPIILDSYSSFSQMKPGNNKKLERHMDKVFKSLTPPKAPSMFEQCKALRLRY